MAKFSMKKSGKEVGSADVYAKPHTMTGNALNVKDAVVKTGNAMDELKISVAGISKSQKDEVKTDGIKQRGAGAATKGYTSRGPMA
jgi:hypothetical protein